MRSAPPVVIDQARRRELERLSRKRSMAARVMLRSRIVLLAGEGMQNKQISERLGVSTRMVAVWRGRFIEYGIEGLLKDAPRPERTPGITAEIVDAIVAKNTQSTPANATHWSTRAVARVRRIWHAHELKPHRVESFKVSNDLDSPPS